MENTQQQPQFVTPEELFSKAFGGTEKTEEKKEETPLPTQPKTEEVKTELPLPPTVTEDKKKEEDSLKPTTTIYSDKIKTFISEGFLEDVEITVDGEQVFLSEMNIQDEDTYKTILEQIKEEKETKLKDKYISKEGLDPITEKLIEIRKAGGDITDLIKENVQAIDQLSFYKETLEDGDEKDKEQLAISILAQDLKQKGLTDRVIQAQLQDFVQEGVLEEEAKKVLNTHLSLHEQAIEDKKNQELERVAKEKEENKNFKKGLSSTYKSWNLPENITKVLVENATKSDEYQITNTDKLYFDVKQKDQELFAKLNFFLNNPKEFEKWIAKDRVLDAKKEIIKSSIVINTSKTKPIKQSSGNNLDDIAENIFNK